MDDYTKDESGETWWCNSHQRQATYLFRSKHVCDPALAGNLAPCDTVNLTDIAEVSDG